jgi:hypothetical protein
MKGRELLWPWLEENMKSLSDNIFLEYWGGARLSPLGTAATNWPTLPAPDDRWWWVWSSRWNEDWQGKLKYSEKTCPIATLFTKNPTWRDPSSNPGRWGGQPASNRLSYSTDTEGSWYRGQGSNREPLKYKRSVNALSALLGSKAKWWTNVFSHNRHLR